jgi:hypothetical protein
MIISPSLSHFIFLRKEKATRPAFASRATIIYCRRGRTNRLTKEKMEIMIELVGSSNSYG